MPIRNVSKPDVAESFYHVYARGASKQTIFREAADFNYFISLFSRYLSKKPEQNKTGILYPHFHDQLELLAFCLMGNHFHLLLYQREQGSMRQFMKSIMNSYCRYFNLKYKRTGSLYESTYKASLINDESYLLHISRYIHLNPRYWQQYKYSSISHYIQDSQTEWLQNNRIMELFNDVSDYKNFVEDYEEHKQMLDELKHGLADM